MGFKEVDLENLINLAQSKEKSEEKTATDIKKITRVQQQKYNKERYSIFLNEEYAFSVSEDVLVRYSLLKGKELEKDFIKNILIAEEESKAKSAALRYLGYRMRSKKEISDKLYELGYSDYTDNIMDFLIENKFLDDREYALCFAKDKMNLKNFGKNRISNELRQKGIDDSMINSVLNELDYGDREYDMAYESAEKRMNRSYKNDDDRYRKIYGFLVRRGYSIDITKKVLRDLLK